MCALQQPARIKNKTRSLAFTYSHKEGYNVPPAAKKWALIPQAPQVGNCQQIKSNERLSARPQAAAHISRYREMYRNEYIHQCVCICVYLYMCARTYTLIGRQLTLRCD